MIADVTDWPVIYIGGEAYVAYRECPVCYAICRSESAVGHRLWHMERKNPESVETSLDRILRGTRTEGVKG